MATRKSSRRSKTASSKRPIDSSRASQRMISRGPASVPKKSRQTRAARGKSSGKSANGTQSDNDEPADSEDLDQVGQLLLQALEHEKGGVQVYETAIKCAVMPELAEEWEKYLDQTRMHVRVLTEVLTAVGLDPERETPGRRVVRHLGTALVQAMQMARDGSSREAAQIVACECIVLAETKDHLDWELIGRVANAASGEQAQLLRNAYEQIEDEEDEHLYHSKGWCRELWLKSLELSAVLPPPEERKHVTTALEAAKVERASLESR